MFFLHQCLPACILLRFLIFFSISACTPRLSILFSDMHFCSFLLLCFSSCTSCFYTHASLTTATLMSSMFFVFILYVHLLLPPCAMPLHSLHSVTVLLIDLFTTTPPFRPLVPSSISLFSSFCITSHVNSSSDHHVNSSSFLAVTPMHSSSLGVMLRFLSFTGSPDSSSSLGSVNRLYDQSSLHWQIP
jgi:hypothetical protein